jgi:pre-rRNA-processing protein TSR2
MNLRSGAVVGAGLVPPELRPTFEEGVSLVMAQWTALALAVENEWGGPYSRDKARELAGHVAGWFYGRKGESCCFRSFVVVAAAAPSLPHDAPHQPPKPNKTTEHFPDELEEVLEDALVEDFNVEAEDGSPREVAQALCALHDELAAAAATAAAAGAASGPLPATATPRLQALRARAAAAAAARRTSKAAGGGGGGEGSSSDDDDEDDDEDSDEEMGEAGGAAGGAAVPPPRAPRPPPVVDEDGFTAVQGRRRR